ncbi:MAG TPA: DUF3540 domain-containing protein [Polyangiaceae bacterium]|nr:DUF3540 domain-containing protein [Polyangiaceae bacterium]
MQNLARKLNREQVTLDEGTVIEAEGGSLRVRVGDFECEARRAKSCLVSPSAGDEVLVAFGRGNRCFVLALLEEAEPQGKTTLEVEGDLDIRVPAGKASVSAAKGIGLTSGDELSLAAQALHVTALEGTVFVQKLAYLGSRLKAEVEGMKVVGSVCDSLFDRVSQRVKRSLRTVEDIDQVRAKKIDYASESTMSLRAENAVVHAEELVKVDASQIQLG